MAEQNNVAQLIYAGMKHLKLAQMQMHADLEVETALKDFYSDSDIWALYYSGENRTIVAHRKYKERIDKGEDLSHEDWVAYENLSNILSRGKRYIDKWFEQHMQTIENAATVIKHDASDTDNDKTSEPEQTKLVEDETKSSPSDTQEDAEDLRVKLKNHWENR